MVNTPLRCAGGDYAWATAVVYSGTLGSALHNDWCLHFLHPACAIPDDFFPAHVALLQPGSLVADHRAGHHRDDHGAARFLDSALACRPNEKSLSSRPRVLRGLRMNQRRFNARWRLQFLGLFVLLGLAALLGKLWYVQVAHGPEWRDKIRGSSEATVRIPSVRGEIRDRNGTTLVQNRASYEVDF